jgi:hypothetical protein
MEPESIEIVNVKIKGNIMTVIDIHTAVATQLVNSAPILSEK